MTNTIQKVEHIRNTSKGTYTIVYNLGTDGVNYAIARCNPKDQFSRKMGTLIAKKRLEKTGGHFISYDEIGSDRYRDITNAIVKEQSVLLPDQGSKIDYSKLKNKYV